jgi:hypothetical protein
MGAGSARPAQLELAASAQSHNLLFVTSQRALDQVDWTEAWLRGTLAPRQLIVLRPAIQAEPLVEQRARQASAQIRMEAQNPGQ